MLLYILNTNFDRVAVMDAFESVIWTDRCREAGDFELVTFPTAENIENCRTDYYVENVESEHLMIIEKLNMTSDEEDGDLFTVSGSSLEKILDRRVIWDDIIVTGPIQDCIKKLIDDAIISPTNKERAIPNFVFESSDDPKIATLSMSVEYKRGDNLYDAVKDTCEKYDLNFKIILNSNKQFVFKLYYGMDRSYAQNGNPYVVFSPDFENIITSNYTSSKENQKNVCLVSLTKTSTNGEKPVILTAVAGDGEGLTRREMFSDGSGVPEKNAADKSYSDTEREALMSQVGAKSLGDYKEEVIFEGESDASGSFVYNRDFDLGDIVQVKNAYGMGNACLIKEIIWSQDANGVKCYPTFQSQDVTEEGYLFYNGNQYRAVTGGWTIWQQDGADFTTEIGNVLRMDPHGKNWNVASAAFATVAKIDLTGYKTLNAELIGDGHIYISPTTQRPWIDMVKNLNITIAGGYKYTIDISDINEPCYICFAPWITPCYVEAYKIWLTK